MGPGMGYYDARCNSSTFRSLFIRRRTIPRVPERSSTGLLASLPLDGWVGILLKREGLFRESSDASPPVVRPADVLARPACVAGVEHW